MSASARSSELMASPPLRKVLMAASLHRLSRWAPDRPKVSLDRSSRFTLSERGLFLRWILRISSRPFLSGRPTFTVRSNLPGRRTAGSSKSGRFVAPITRVLTSESNLSPSISTRSWFKVWSYSKWPTWAPRLPASTSISSINITAPCLRCSLASFLAPESNSRIRCAPSPAYTSMNSEPEAEMNTESV